jgi:signal transduction histidine kinase
VHETGARMTHDVKNLLQSLNALCAVAEREPEGESAELQALIRRQLPVIARRLGDTLERLQQPNPQTEPLTPADDWWESLALQYRDKRVEFAAAEGLRPGVRIPRGLFDSVADNLLQNALAKREAATAVRIRVTLTCGERVELRVCDTGQAVQPELVTTLLRAPVVSGSGLGIGLYQAARQAEASGYLLELKENRDGEVCFALSGGAPVR